MDDETEKILSNEIVYLFKEDKLHASPSTSVFTS